MSKILERAILENKVWYHLHFNHYPPLPDRMVVPCARAIPYGKKGDWKHRIRLPKGITWGGKKTISVGDAFDYHDLYSFI
jgi:hypothetical protein